MSEQGQSGTSWDAATVDGSVVERLNEYEQGFREERAEAKAKIGSYDEIEEYIEVNNVTDPSRVYEPQVDEEVSRAARMQDIRGQLGSPVEHEAKPVESGNRLDEIKQQLSGGNEIEL